MPVPRMRDWLVLNARVQGPLCLEAHLQTARQALTERSRPIRRTTVSPGITSARLREVWEDAKQEAYSRPGMTVTILFNPGKYPLPAPGAYAYDQIEEPVHVGPGGMEVHFVVRPTTGALRIYAGRNVRQNTRRRTA